MLGGIYGIQLLRVLVHTCSFTIQASEDAKTFACFAVTRRCKHSAQDKDGPSSTRAGPRKKLPKHQHVYSHHNVRCLNQLLKTHEVKSSYQLNGIKN